VLRASSRKRNAPVKVSALKGVLRRATDQFKQDFMSQRGVEQQLRRDEQVSSFPCGQETATPSLLIEANQSLCGGASWAAQLAMYPADSSTTRVLPGFLPVRLLCGRVYTADF
jgi:hypothetical protein